jgi:dihydrofolate reductase
VVLGGPVGKTFGKDVMTNLLFLLGRETYEKFAATWSQVKRDPYFDRVNSLPKLVASRTLASATWNAEIIKGNVADEIARLKKQPGKDIIK